MSNRRFDLCRHAFGILTAAALVVLVFVCGRPSAAEIKTDTDEVWPSEAWSEKGYDLLVNRAYVPAGFGKEVFDNLWRSWEEPLHSKAEKATPQQRRRMALSRYGLTEAPGRIGGIPMQYADDGKGGWATNCLTCHGGKVAGKIIPGAPNTGIALQTLVQDVVATKRLLGKKVPPSELGAALIPLGGSNGTTNAIIFGVVLGSMRDADLNVHTDRPMPKLMHNDHDAPAWWNYKYKTYLYADGFAPRGHRALMQFMMAPSNGPEVFHKAEADFEEIEQWLMSLDPPKYPWPINQALADRGEVLFNQTCSECHGTYGENASYPNKNVPLDVVGTDRARWDSLTTQMRAGYKFSWFGRLDGQEVIANPEGYVAQPLYGIWASAPYLHNGSVPTLWHLFHPDKRPVVWKRTENGYDTQRVGLEVTEYDDLPAGVKGSKQKRTFFDTRKFAKSAQGHLFPDELSEDEKQAVMEYLKTL